MPLYGGRLFAIFLVLVLMNHQAFSVKRPVLIWLMISAFFVVEGQKQLVLLNKEDVLLRLYPGDEIIYKLKGDKTIRTTYVNDLSATAVMTHTDTVPYNRIDRIYFRQHKFYNTVGSGLVIFGAGLFLIDQVNVVIVNQNSPNLDSRVSAISLSSLAVGLPMMLIRKKSRKLKYRTRLMMVEKGSGFYRPDARETVN